MSVRLIKSFTWLWIASLLIATVGLSGQQIYCYCMGKTSFSLFALERACAEQQKSETNSCCLAGRTGVSHACCKKKDSSNAPQGCTKKTTKVFQLKTEFTLQEKVAEHLPFFDSDQDFTVISFPYFTNVPRSQKIDFKSFAQPPPLSGRMICVRHGVFRC